MGPVGVLLGQLGICITPTWKRHFFWKRQMVTGLGGGAAQGSRHDTLVQGRGCLNSHCLSPKPEVERLAPGTPPLVVQVRALVLGPEATVPEDAVPGAVERDPTRTTGA